MKTIDFASPQAPTSMSDAQRLLSALLLASSLVLFESMANTQVVNAQMSGNQYGYGAGRMNGNQGLMGGTGGGSGGGAGGYAGTAQANIDRTMLGGNKEMLRDDIDYEDYLLQKRTAFASQLQQNEQAEEKLRAYAEQRLKSLGKSKAGAARTLTASEQAEAHDLIDWLKKDAEQRANNRAWLKRQDQTLAYLEQDQFVSLKNQRNSLHNLMEDNIAVRDQLKWNQTMQLAQLHLQQNAQGAVSWGRPPQDGLNNAFGGGYGNGGFGYGGYGYGGRGFGRRWGY